jgi:sec-independent protein translocase protein TatA
MITPLAAIFGGWEMLIILAIALLFFGAKKLPELARGMGQSVKEFKKATQENDPKDPGLAAGAGKTGNSPEKQQPPSN